MWKIGCVLLFAPPLMLAVAHSVLAEVPFVTGISLTRQPTN